MQEVEIYCKDKDAYKTCFTDRYNTFKGQRDFSLLLPWSNDTAVVVARNNRTKNRGGISIVKVERQHLPTAYDAFDYKSPIIREFLELARFICTRSSYLNEGKFYSNKRNIELWLMRELLVDIDGTEVRSKSPARVNSITGRIQCNKNTFDAMTVAGRFAILCHEFAHFYLNKDKSNEEEADYNAANIYLGMGFPRVELLTWWSRTLKNNPTESNVARYNKYIKYVNDFKHIS
jgi:hypothetical protein